MQNPRIPVHRRDELCFRHHFWCESKASNRDRRRRVEVCCKVSHHLSEYKKHQWHSDTRCKSTDEACPYHQPVEFCTKSEDALRSVSLMIVMRFTIAYLRRNLPSWLEEPPSSFWHLFYRQGPNLYAPISFFPIQALPGVWPLFSPSRDPLYPLLEFRCIISPKSQSQGRSRQEVRRQRELSRPSNSIRASQYQSICY